MSITHRKFIDIICSKDFYTDYDHAPERVKQRVNILIELIAEEGFLPNSLQTHKAEFFDGLYIGYVTVGKSAWRILFSEDGYRLLFERLLSHKDMDRYLSGN